MSLKLYTISLFIWASSLNMVTTKLYSKIKSGTDYSHIKAQQSGETFYKNQCAFCHTSEQLIAPDMNKIRAKYLEKYKTKDAFVKAVLAFVKNPVKKNAIYKDGIDNFTAMPKMPFKDAQIKATATYIYSASKL